jgi:hypothetical protein
MVVPPWALPAAEDKFEMIVKGAEGLGPRQLQVIVIGFKMPGSI